MVTLALPPARFPLAALALFAALAPAAAAAHAAGHDNVCPVGAYSNEQSRVGGEYWSRVREWCAVSVEPDAGATPVGDVCLLMSASGDYSTGPSGSEARTDYHATCLAGTVVYVLDGSSRALLRAIQ